MKRKAVQDDNFIGGIFITIKAIYMQCQLIDNTNLHRHIYICEVYKEEEKKR